ncbi:hypothetical protein AVEN_139248-1 [Araneus ventricosus]|uniref:Uncharacterized protein n=1 Tax=Araneus ventricosus TaxID=182803 RepID=A0A4Y2M9I2_ARAVE|nr:hypothetical protein AVEN_139248-1 [Araneus ventricosus]
MPYLAYKGKMLITQGENSPHGGIVHSHKCSLSDKICGPEDVLEEIFTDHESFCEHDTESEEDRDSVNEDVNNLELFSSKEDNEWRKTKFRQNIRCHNIVSSLPRTTTKKNSERYVKPCEELGVIHQR